MIILAFILIIGISAIVISVKRKRAKRNARRDAEDQRIREEIARMRKEADAEAKRMRSVIREQMQQRAEQERQAEMLAKHEAQITNLLFRIEQAEDIIAHNSEILEMLSAQMDEAQKRFDDADRELFIIRYQLENAARLTGKQRSELFAQYRRTEKQREQAQNKVITLKNKMFTSEMKIKKASADKAEAERKIG